MPAYAELQITSNFSFLRGASHADEFAIAAGALGLKAIAITDRNSLAGVVRAHVAAKDAGIQLVVGARLDLIQDATPTAVVPIKKQQLNSRTLRQLGGQDAALNRDTADPNLDIDSESSNYTITDPRDPTAGMSLLAYPLDRSGYADLCRLLTLGRRRAPKGECYIDLNDVRAHSDNMIFVVLPPAILTDDFVVELETLGRRWQGRCYLAAHQHLNGYDKLRLEQLAHLAEQCGTPLLATNDAHMHCRSRKPLQDILTCIRQGCTIDEAGYYLFPNAERCLKSAGDMAVLFEDYPDALRRSLEISKRCQFSLDELKYEYPEELGGESGDTHAELERLAWEGAKNRFGTSSVEALPEKIRQQIDHELALVRQLNYAPYFLTVYDIVRFARSRGILCQGRGSAANSTVCYCLGITSVDPARIDLLFERFISEDRDEPPDIDVDFEHERREEVMQYIYEKYGRHRAGLTATVICYRTRGAIRDVGKALGLSEDVIAAVSANLSGWNGNGMEDERVAELGLDIDAPRLRQAIDFSNALRGFPRHLSQHVGGFVLTNGPLHELVPISNASMVDRTVVEWDKDDLEALGILKVDVLALGMLSCMRRCFDLIDQHYGQRLELATLPPEDPQVYDMLCRADSIGVFQVESRAQMAMLPRLKPRTFYDLVVEVAIVRPGPIQGNMVHPYLRRRSGEEKIEYPSEELREVLGKTMGVPLFQEQAMKIAIVAAGFTPGEADQLRRAMATFKKSGQIGQFGARMREGMIARGYDPEFAERCFKQIEGFGTYGFPESHAASFALLVYTSSWMKCHYPEVFCCALLNSQPMGFYAPAQLIRDARDHGVEVLPVDVNLSDWDNTLEYASGRVVNPAPRFASTYKPRGMAVRLGLRQIKGLSEQDAARILTQRGNGYPDLLSLWRRSGVKTQALEAIARADGYGSLDLARREAFWAIKALPDEPLPLFAAIGHEEWQTVDGGKDSLPTMNLGEQVADDYRAMRLSLKAHPMSLVREALDAEAMMPGTNVRVQQRQQTAADLWHSQDGEWIRTTGVVLVRQRPGSASGVIFISLEDETGVTNIVVWPSVFEQFRREILSSSLIQVDGRVQKVGRGEHQVVHVVANHLVDRTALLVDMQSGDNDMTTGDEQTKDMVLGGLPFDTALAHADEVTRPIADDRASASLTARDEAPHRVLPSSSPSVKEQITAADGSTMCLPRQGGQRHPRDVQIRFPIRHATGMTTVGRQALAARQDPAMAAIAPGAQSKPPSDIEKKRDQASRKAPQQKREASYLQRHPNIGRPESWKGPKGNRGKMFG